MYDRSSVVSLLGSPRDIRKEEETGMELIDEAICIAVWYFFCITVAKKKETLGGWNSGVTANFLLFTFQI